jgi:hypothetical protein
MALDTEVRNASVVGGTVPQYDRIGDPEFKITVDMRIVAGETADGREMIGGYIVAGYAGHKPFIGVTGSAGSAASHGIAGPMRRVFPLPSGQNNLCTEIVGAVVASEAIDRAVVLKMFHIAGDLPFTRCHGSHKSYETNGS